MIWDSWGTLTKGNLSSKEYLGDPNIAVVGRV